MIQSVNKGSEQKIHISNVADLQLSMHKQFEW